MISQQITECTPSLIQTSTSNTRPRTSIGSISKKATAGWTAGDPLSIETSRFPFAAIRLP